MSDKIRTDNIPLMDEVVYYLKRLATESVIKNQYLADKHESLNSIKNFDLYKMCYLNTARYSYFDYDFDELDQTSIMKKDIYNVLKDKMSASEKIKNELLENKKKQIIQDFVETNDYYRMLNGEPNINDLDEIYIDPADLSEDDILYIDTDTPIYLLTNNEQEFLNTTGIIDKYIDMYPDKKYLKYIGDRKIDIFTARNSKPFGLLYVPKDGIPMEVYSRWIEKYNINRDFTMKTFYDSVAFSDENDYYEEFIAMLIVIQTMVDIVAELPDFLIKRDIFDLGTIKLILKSYDVDYFPNIPLNYQKAIVRNINKLVEMKSTESSIVNICSLFGCDNIEVFKYYLFKSRKLDEDNNFEFNEDDYDNYKFKFIKCPIDGNIDDYIHDKSKYLIYDDVTYGDKWWDGGLDHESVEKAIKDHQFNYLQSKYYSIDCVFSMTELLFKLVYFYNMIFDDVFSEDLLRVNLYCVSNRYSFKLVNVFCYLFGLAYTYYGLEDQILFDQKKILIIKGFDFNVDMAQLNDYIVNKTQGLDNVYTTGVGEFNTFEENDRILTYNQLTNVFINNKNIYDHVVHSMLTANNKREYDLYKKLYDSMMTIKLSNKFFKKSDGTVATSFTDFLKDRDINLYNSLISIKTLENPDDRQQMAATMIDDIIYVLEHQYLTDKVFEKIYKVFPTADADSIIIYIKELIEFFKSYKMQLDQINIIYLLDDKYENWCGAIDEVLLKIKMSPTACGSDKDLISVLHNNNGVLDKDSTIPLDALYISSEYFKDSPLYEDGQPKDIPLKSLVSLMLNDEDYGSGYDYLKIFKTYN